MLKIKDIEITKERLIGFAIALGVVLALMLHGFLYRPLINRLRLASSECTALEAELSQVQDTAAFIKSSPQRMTLIGKGNVSLAIDELTRKGKLKGINFIALTQRETLEAKEGSYRLIPIEIETESTYADLGIFLGSLDKLENSLITVENFSIYPDKDNPAKLASRIIINIYIAGKDAE